MKALYYIILLIGALQALISLVKAGKAFISLHHSKSGNNQSVINNHKGPIKLTKPSSAFTCLRIALISQNRDK